MPSRLDPFFRGAIDAFHVACLRLGRAGGTGARPRRDRPDGTPGAFRRTGREELERSPDAAEWAPGPAARAGPGARPQGRAGPVVEEASGTDLGITGA